MICMILSNFVFFINCFLLRNCFTVKVSPKIAGYHCDDLPLTSPTIEAFCHKGSKFLPPGNGNV